MRTTVTQQLLRSIRSTMATPWPEPLALGVRAEDADLYRQRWGGGVAEGGLDAAGELVDRWSRTWSQLQPRGSSRGSDPQPRVGGLIGIDDDPLGALVAPAAGLAWDRLERDGDPSDFGDVTRVGSSRKAVRFASLSCTTSQRVPYDCAVPFTLRNLKEDLEDVGSNFDGAPDLEFRLATEALELEQSGLSYQRVPPGYRFPYGHTHEKQEEVYVVVRGSGRMKLDDEIVELKEWDAVRVPPGTWRGYEAGPDGLEILVIGAPSLGEARREDVEGQRDWWAGCRRP